MRRSLVVFLLVLTTAVIIAAQPPPLDVTVQPVEGGAVVYSPIAPRSTDFGPAGQIGLLLKLENKGTKTLLINKINVRYEVSESIFGSASVSQDGIIPLSMGPGSVYYWCHQRDKDRDTMIYMPENWEPKKITISVYCDGCSQPVTVSMPLKKHPSPFAGGSYRFPTRAEDLGSGEYWSTSSSHGTSYFGSQLFAYDMGVTRWDSDSKQYSVTKSGTTGCQISDYLSYGKPVYAMADGEVAWNPTNNVKDNPMAWRLLGDTTKKCVTPDEMKKWTCVLPPGTPGGGNNISIITGMELHSYAHFQAGTINPKFLQKGAKVKAGELLGLIGATGCSTYPHVHFDTVRIHEMRSLKARSDTNNSSPNLVSLRPLMFHDVYTIDQSLSMRRDPQPEKWSKVDDQAIPKPISLIWASNTKPCFYIPNAPELAVHGVAEAD